MGWTLGIGVALLALLILWPKLMALLPASASGKVTAAISTASGYVSDAAADAALQSLVVLCWTHEDTATIVLIDQVRKAIQSWNSPPAVVVPVSPEVAALQAQVAALTTIVASQTTSKPPASTAAPGA